MHGQVIVVWMANGQRVGIGGRAPGSRVTACIYGADGRRMERSSLEG